MGNKENHEEEIDLLWLFRALVKRLWLIISVAVICACTAAGYTHLRIAPTYVSTTTMLVMTQETTLSSLANLQLGSQLKGDYTILITSRPVVEEVIENLGLDMNYYDLANRISITNPEDTRILYISVTLNNPKQAKVVVDELARVSAQFIAEQMDIGAPKIVEEGVIPTGRSGPNLAKNTMIGFLIGALLVVIILVVLELLNDTIQTEDDIENYLGLPTFAVVPDRIIEKKERRVRHGVQEHNINRQSGRRLPLRRSH